MKTDIGAKFKIAPAHGRHFAFNGAANDYRLRCPAIKV